MVILLKVVPRIAPETYSQEYAKRKAQFEVARKKAKALLHPFAGKEDYYYEFNPQSKKEWETYMTYVMARGLFEDLPEYHFGKIGLSVYYIAPLYPWDSNDKVFKGLEEDRALIFVLLKKYKLPK